MRQTGRGRPRRAEWRRGLVVVAFAGLVTCAGAQLLTLQTEFQYRWVETTSGDGHRTSYSRFTPLYLLNVRGPLIGGADIEANVGLSGMSSIDRFASVDQRNLRLDLSTAAEHLDLSASLSRDTNRVTYAGLGGRRSTLASATNNLTLTGALRCPRYPNVTFQYAWTESAVEGAGRTTGTTWLVAGNYEWGPLRLMADQSSQSFGGVGGSSRRSQYGLSYSQSLAPRIELSVDQLWTSTVLETPESALNSRGSTTTARVTTYPTPAVVLTGEFGLTSGSPGGVGGDLQGRTRSHRYSVDVRTEVVPGTRLDFSSRSQSYDSVFGRSTTQELAVDMDARLGPNTVLGAQWNRSRNDFAAAFFQHEEGINLTASSRLSTDARVQGSVGATRQTNERGSQQALSAEVGVSYEVRPNLSLSGSYDFLRRRDDQGGQESRDIIHSVMLDARWAPNRQWDVRAGVGITSRQNSESGLSVDPYAELRWSPTYATTLTVRQYVDYNSERSREDGVPFRTTRAAAGFSARLSHQLSENESLRIGYQESGGLGGTLDSQRMLQVNYAKTF